MRFGLFGGARTKRAVGLGDSHGYKDFIDYVVEAERLGFQHMFMVEHHFTGQGQVSASMTLLAYLAAKTQRIRLGTAVVVLPWHNPVLVAEQAATLDLLSGAASISASARAIARRSLMGSASRPLKRPNALMKRLRSSARPGLPRTDSPITASAGITKTSLSNQPPCSVRIRPSGWPPEVK